MVELTSDLLGFLSESWQADLQNLGWVSPICCHIIIIVQVRDLEAVVRASMNCSVASFTNP